MSSVNLSTSSFIATNAINQGFNNLAQNSQAITNSLIGDEQNSKNPTVNQSNLYMALNSQPQPSVEASLINLHQNKTQIMSLLKVVQVENQLFNDSLGKIFDTWA